MKTSEIRELIEERQADISIMDNQIMKWEKYHQESPIQTENLDGFRKRKCEAKFEMNELNELLTLTEKYEMEVEV